ncbi:MAG: hypothetical protein JHC81_11145 [Brevundimonas sp.]|uniref:hypothetical protein n=1 Tax=Brevundimonas sp. TaxID=1871086 RepID=UPI001A2038EC|nr:hypothetical protein [Brevundimonas sp.]MBJ7448080.1 hypothetical protein [Brevundimonas sp.]
MRVAIFAFALVITATSASAQTPPPALAPASNPAYAADVASMDAIVAALYASISGDAGVARDWDRFRNLFHPSARLMPTGTDAQRRGTLRPLTPQDYVDRAGPSLIRDGFHEQEIARRTDRYGRIAHLFSTYEARRAATDARPFMRGINSIQLFDDGTRWWIVSVYWQAETPDLPLPADYLPEAN